MASDNLNDVVAKLRSELRSSEFQRRIAWGKFYDERRERIRVMQELYERLEEMHAVSGNDDSSTARDHLTNQLRALMGDTKQQIECPICLNGLHPAISNRKHEKYVLITGCGHMMCNKCAHSIKQHGRTTCPTCRQSIEPNLHRLEDIDPNAQETVIRPEDVGLQNGGEEQQVPDDAIASTFPGKCKACFENIERGGFVVRHSVASKVYVHVGCRDVELQRCHHCEKRFGDADNVLGKYVDRVLACNDCGLRYGWRGAKRPNQPANRGANKRRRA